MNRRILPILREKLRERLDSAREYKDEEILELIDELIIEECRNYGVSFKEKTSLRMELFHGIRKLDILQDLLEDESITEIMVNGPEHIFIERYGRIQPFDRTFASREKLEDVIQQIVGKCNRVVNESRPIVDARLETGERVNAVIAPVALNGPILTIRRFPATPITMEWLIRKGSITQEAARFLKEAVEAHYTILIGGGTGSGKTTFLGALCGFISPGERLITIEDSAELQIQGIENLVRLEAKMANLEGGMEVSIRDLIKASLRMRPNRIIVGEVRGAEAVDMLQALNTGHEGSISTIHANSGRDMLSRLETMILMGMNLPLEAIRRQMVSGVDLLVYLGRLGDGSRKVLEITEVLDYREGEIRTENLFKYSQKTGLQKTGSLINCEKMERKGSSEKRL